MAREWMAASMHERHSAVRARRARRSRFGAGSDHRLTQERPQPAARWLHGSLRITNSTTRGRALAPICPGGGRLRSGTGSEA
jgi:hypothetical protein